MIVVLGDVKIRDEALAEALESSREHVARSRLEPGCISHDVHQHVDDPNRLVFVERWADHAALRTHFGVAASIAFARSITDLAVDPPRMNVYEVTEPSDD